MHEEETQQRLDARAPDDGFVPLEQVHLPAHTRLDLAAIRARLAGQQGPRYWRSLDELADTPEFRRFVEREFPYAAPRDMAPLSRREFLRVMGAGLALAGVSGCGLQPAEQIVPYIEQPENVVPGKPLFYATAFTRGGYALGVLGETHLGRPIKLEGNPDHPASLGATDAFTQAAILGLYDPDRSQSVRRNGDPSTWDVFLGEIAAPLRKQRQKQGAGLALILGPSTSPTLRAQLRKLAKQYPAARVVMHDPAGRESAHQGAREALGEPLNPVYHLGQARCIVSLDANFLVDEPGSVRYARDFVQGRLIRDGQKQMSRLYVAECMHTITGAKADHRVPVRASEVAALARALAAELGVSIPGVGEAGAAQVPENWLKAVAQDLRAHQGAGLVIVGAHQPAEVHALAHSINRALGNFGKTVTFTAPLEVEGSTSLEQLVTAIKGGQVELLFVLGANPVYSAPADLELARVLEQVDLRVHQGLYDDETGVQCHWHLPESHFLEAWSDAAAYDGTVSLVQPLIVPLYASRSVHELLSALMDEGDRPGLEILREFWQQRDPRFAPPKRGQPTPGRTLSADAGAGTSRKNPEFEHFWHSALVKGVVPGFGAPARNPGTGSGAAPAPAAAPAGQGTFDVCFRPDPTIWDGSYANNGWLQELPKPITKLTWDNAALISYHTAQQLGVDRRDLLRITVEGRSLDVPVWIMPGHADHCVTLTLGYGRTRAGRVGTGTGFNAYALRTSGAPWIAAGAQVTKTEGSYPLVATQDHFRMEGRGLVRVGTLAEWVEHPDHPPFAAHGHHEEGAPKSLYPQSWSSDKKDPEPPPGRWEGEGPNGRPIPAWGMVIDLQACIGCSACTMACQAENNIATVGKDQVHMNREMHWLRIDTYFEGGLDNPDTVFQPLPCMHCEKAPCEPVCPVQATTHSAEGINEQTYNRCIGTRYCENNCPYKVRHFNYLQYSDHTTPTLQLMRNPDVTVRARGVMEKCTFCIQRINEGRIESEKEDRPIRDGDVKTACQQVCPTQAIIFGDVNDAGANRSRDSRVRQLKHSPLNYVLLEELNTRPRTSYLAAVRNRSPALGGAPVPESGHEGGGAAGAAGATHAGSEGGH